MSGSCFRLIAAFLKHTNSCIDVYGGVFGSHIADLVAAHEIFNGHVAELSNIITHVKQGRISTWLKPRTKETAGDQDSPQAIFFNALTGFCPTDEPSEAIVAALPPPLPSPVQVLSFREAADTPRGINA